MVTNRVENDNAFGPQSHGVGLSSAGCLNSWRNSAPQGTRPTLACPGLSGYPKIEHLLVDGYDVVCNKQKVQGYRAPGQSQATLAVETVIDALAEKLGMDPMEFRLKNAVQAGDPMPNGTPHAPFGCRELEEAMLAHPHY